MSGWSFLIGGGFGVLLLACAIDFAVEHIPGLYDAIDPFPAQVEHLEKIARGES